MKTSGWNKLPLWARYFCILIGFPLVVAILRVTLEHRFPRLTANILVVAVLLVISMLIFWKRKNHPSQRPDPPLTKDEKQHEKIEERKLSCLMFAIFTIVLLTGTFFCFCILFEATPPGYPALLFGVFRLFGAAIGLVLLLVTFICFQETKFEFLLLKGAKPSATSEVSAKAALCALAIVLAIAFIIAKLAHL